MRAPLVHQIGDDNPWTGWPDWFTTLGLAAPVLRRFFVNNHMIALQAAEDDIGAVLAWEGLMRGVLGRGCLINLVPESVPSKTPFCLRVRPGLSGRARLFADWLIANAAPASRSLTPDIGRFPGGGFDGGADRRAEARRLGRLQTCRRGAAIIQIGRKQIARARRIAFQKTRAA